MAWAARILALFLIVLSGSEGMAFEDLDAESAADLYVGELAAVAPAKSESVENLRADTQLLLQQERWVEARDIQERLVARLPRDASAWVGLAMSWQSTDRGNAKALAAAYQAYRVAGSGDEKGTALALVGSAFAESGRHSTALAAVDEALTLNVSPDVRSALLGTLEKIRFQPVGLSVNTNSDRPEICVEFRRPIAKSKSLHLEDYVRVTPEPEGGIHARQQNLCVDGVDYGQSYEVTIRAGLPAADGTKVRVEETFEAAIGDRSPSVAFKGGTYVLPRTGSTGIPVQTVNVEAVKLSILRINERNLIHELNGERFQRLLNTYSTDYIGEQDGRVIWSGEMDVPSEKNTRVTTAFDVGTILGTPKPGVYILVAEPAAEKLEQWQDRATQWFVVSDLGLSVLGGDDGLTVFTRSLGTAKPKADVTVRLMSRDNDVLAEAVSDADGGARIGAALLRGEGGRRPRALYAETADGDFTFLDLDGVPFDLSDRGVGGRTPPGPLDVFLYSDRGVYRRGESAHVAALLRDESAMAVDGVPLTLKVLRPDGAESARHVVKATAPGFYALDLPFSADAWTGSWTVQAYVDPKAEPIGTLPVLVEDVVPPRIEVKLASAAAQLTPGESFSVSVQADYLYGAPADGLNGEAELVILPDDHPFEAFAGYRFGLTEEEVRPVRVTLPAGQTDAKGGLSLVTVLNGVPDVTVPLKAVIRAGVFEAGGRPATGSLTVPIRQHDNAVGVRSRFKEGSVKEGTEAGFDVIVLGRDGNRRSANLKYAFIREEWDFRWFLRDGVWDYEVNVIDRPLGGGDLNVGSEEPSQVATMTDWGRYRLEVYDPQTGAATSVRFKAGWFVAPSAGDTPDTLEVVADRPVYRPGDAVRLHVRAPFAGEALVVVANHRVLETRLVSLPEEGAEVDLTFKDDWGVGAYVLATAFRPDGESRGPGRAIGLAWLGLDAGPRTLGVAIEAPKQVRPRTRVDVPVTVSGSAPGDDVYVTLAAVDEGVLQLTRFETPEPVSHYFGKRKLGVSIRDLYGRLIDAKAQRRGRIRSGGGDPRLAAGAGAPPVDVRITALFSGIVKLDGDDKAVIGLDIPDYNGRLRLMAVAGSRGAVGSGESAMIVRDPVLVQTSTARFLAPGDQGRITIELRNLEGAAGTYAVDLSVDGVAKLAQTGRFDVDLAAGTSRVFSLPITTRDVGDAAIRLRVEGPEGWSLERVRTLAVRPAQFPVVRRVVKRMEPGESVSYSRRLTEEFRPGTAETSLGFSPRPALDVAGVLQALDRYPYGCLEQTTSRALPLLYVADLASAWGGKGADSATANRVREAIRHVLDMQRADGAFGLWSGAGRAEPWLTSYALDFLNRAKAKGYAVPGFAYDNGLSWLRRFVRENGSNGPADVSARAYAHYVLALSGDKDVGNVRYFMDTNVDGMPTALAAAHLGAALALYGEADRARVMIAKAQPALMKRAVFRDYGTPLRDLAAFLAVTNETSAVIENPFRDWTGRSVYELFETLSERLSEEQYLSSQEMAWILMAANAIGDGNDPMTLQINGRLTEKRTSPLQVRPSETGLAEGLTYANKGAAPIWHVATVSGVPMTEEPAHSDGFDISRVFLDLDGKPIDPRSVRQNDLMVAVIKGRATTNLEHQALVVDLLPAGFEVENARLADRRDTKSFAWLPALTDTEHEEFQDDRYIAAFDLKKDDGDFVLAYLARAVTPGTYRLPAVHVEDMYKPRHRGRSDMGSVVISPR